MSWSIRCKFLSMKDGNFKLVSDSFIDRLKCLSERSYSVSFDFDGTYGINIPKEFKIDGYDGYVFTTNDWYNGEQKYLSEYSKHMSEYMRLLNIKNSIEYYKLTEEQKESLVEDLSCREELAEDYKNKADVCRMMINFINYFNDDEILAGEQETFRYTEKVITYLVAY